MLCSKQILLLLAVNREVVLVRNINERAAVHYEAEVRNIVEYWIVTYIGFI